MQAEGFIDYYEVLQVSPRAEPAVISRLYRHLAKRYHPDNAETGDRRMFDLLAEAYETLSNREKRAAYDLLHADAIDDRNHAPRDSFGSEGPADDRIVRDRLLALLYAQRRRDVLDPGIGEVQLERMLGCDREQLAFHLWYLREKKSVERTDRGFAITVLGIDEVEAAHARAYAFGDRARLAAGVRPS